MHICFIYIYIYMSCILHKLYIYINFYFCLFLNIFIYTATKTHDITNFCHEHSLVKGL